MLDSTAELFFNTNFQFFGLVIGVPEVIGGNSGDQNDKEQEIQSIVLGKKSITFHIPFFRP